MSGDQEPKPVEDKEQVEEKQDAPAEDAAEEKTPEVPVKEMRAVVLTGFGGLKSVKVQKKPEPSLQGSAGEILIRVKAW